MQALSSALSGACQESPQLSCLVVIWLETDAADKSQPDLHSCAHSQQASVTALLLLHILRTCSGRKCTCGGR